MSFECSGYPFQLVSKHKCADISAHLCTTVYKFYSLSTGQWYLVSVDQHELNTYILKFCLRYHKRRLDRFKVVVNKGDVPRILRTVSDIALEVMKGDEMASFGAIATRSYDSSTDTEEGIPSQRWRIYRWCVPKLMDPNLFDHFEFAPEGGYLLVNKRHADTEKAKGEIVHMLSQTYRELPDL